MSDEHADGVAHEDDLTEEQAEELLYSAMMNLDRVRNNYPALTEELEDIASYSRTGLAFVYFRIGREESKPSLTELAERDLTNFGRVQHGD